MFKPTRRVIMTVVPVPSGIQEGVEWPERIHELELHARIWKLGLQDFETGVDLFKENVTIGLHPSVLN